MKAIRVSSFGGPEVLKLVSDVPIPSVSSGQVVVKMGAAGVNPVDTYIATGKFAIKPPLPYTPGSDGAGVVHSVGEDVTTVKEGDHVYVCSSLTGTYAEFALCEVSSVHHIPSNISFSQGAAIYIPYYTAYRALFQSVHAKAGETVLVHGASGGVYHIEFHERIKRLFTIFKYLQTLNNATNVGLAAVQLAKAYGMKVLGTAGTAEGEEVVKQAGASQTFNHRQDGYVQKILDATGGHGADVIIEMLANASLSKDLKLVAKKGRIVVIGSRGTIEIDPRETMFKECSISGVLLAAASKSEMQEMAFAIAAGLEAGFLSPVVGHEYQLSQASDAHRDIMEGKGAKGKLVLVT